MEPGLSSNIPSLGMLRAFEAAARHLSFTRAAEELALTQTAISHTIKKLESFLGQELFERDGNRLRLKRAGRDYLPVAREVLTSLHHATERLRQRSGSDTLTFTSVLSFTVTWLLPRLPAFMAANPDLSLRLGASAQISEPVRPDWDVAVLYGAGHWPDAVAERLADEWITPVVSPALLERMGGLREPADLRGHTLLKTSFNFQYRDDWQAWLKAADAPFLEHERSISFDMLFSALEAARLGYGVAMGRTPLVSDDIREGRLVCPFDLTIRSQFGYYLVAAPAVARTSAFRAFRDWIMGEAESTNVPPRAIAGAGG